MRLCVNFCLQAYSDFLRFENSLIDCNSRDLLKLYLIKASPVAAGWATLSSEPLPFLNRIKQTSIIAVCPICNKIATFSSWHNP